MRLKHLKFHLIAIAIISAIILVVFLVFGRPQVAPQLAPEQTSAILIDHATWGKSCDKFIAQGIREWRPAPAGQQGVPKPSYAQHNNALPVLQKACDGRIECDVAATSDTLGVEPMVNCSKRLVVGYRCFAFDRLHILEIAQGNQLSISCHDDDRPATPTPNAQ